ncbi:hypothetical protein H1C71_041946 [Ictidomys tridecemlineatus]|nr:hypothetical protein H1C71_041946 [Ictidomys tridecemlineatus]KAG3294918.1 hypothetical protein H1C71_041946 [Ictidomys tridecemlineatus]KAG3294919.1 hypothetical protein H1C71_041946 [Ictidomys tridecemlineatus]KAG3294920.1 hypothetical protein H1C71_041946 [Ictidomys tridecemlineatus]KAG3294921.1 hypothetical protein H1C71_041946 [Ictidomys tridecemlineatus]
MFCRLLMVGVESEWLGERAPGLTLHQAQQICPGSCASVAHGDGPVTPKGARNTVGPGSHSQRGEQGVSMLTCSRVGELKEEEPGQKYGWLLLSMSRAGPLPASAHSHPL